MSSIVDKIQKNNVVCSEDFLSTAICTFKFQLLKWDNVFPFVNVRLIHVSQNKRYMYLEMKH